MKKILYLFLSFVLSICGVHAQVCSDATVTAVSSASTCQANGSITVTFSSPSGGNLVNKQYTLKSTTGTYTVGPVSTNVIDNLPPGTYNIEAKGFCGSISGESITRTLNNVKVDGSYIEPRMTFMTPSTASNALTSQITSRNSFAACSTGVIVVLLEKGNQTTMPTFRIVSGPAGVTPDQIVGATKSIYGSDAAGWRYELNGTWPAGTYTVSANDGCYSAVTTFVINEIATAPTGTVSFSNFASYNLDPSNCTKLYYQPSYSYGTNADYMRYFNDGLFEYGIAPLGEQPKAENWFKIRYFLGPGSATYQDLVDLSPGKFSDYYGPSNTLTVYTRVKGFPCTTVSADTYLRIPYATINPSTNACTGVNRYGLASYYYSILSNLCFPLTITVTDKASGAVVYTDANFQNTGDVFNWDCNPGESQYLNITDASGYKYVVDKEMVGGTPTPVTKPGIAFRSESYLYYYYCDYYRIPYEMSRGGVPCEGDSPYPCYITITDGTGAVIERDTITATTSTSRNAELKYKVQYTITAVFPNWGNHISSISYKRDTPPLPEIAVGPFPSSSTLRNCDTYQGAFNSTYACYPKPVYVTLTDPSGAVAYKDTLTSAAYKYPDLKYGVVYTATFVYPDMDNYTRTTTIIAGSTVPTSFTLTRSTNACAVNRGSFRISTNGYMLKGTKITITGPEEYVSQTYTTTSQGNSTDSGYTFPEATLPAGDYTATLESCGKTYTVTSKIGAGYAVDNFAYTTDRDCIRTKLFPSGSISLDGTPLPTVYFRVTGPTGSENGTKVIASNNTTDYFSLTVPGTYYLHIMVTSTSSCVTGSQTIVYNPPPLALDTDKTSAYSCPGGSTGYLTLQGTNGVLPYTYSVYDKTNTTQLVAPQTSITAISLDNFGLANETYTVRVSDACGNSFSQQVTLSSLDQVSLAYGQEQTCYASPINLYGFTVSDASYLWTGPNGFTSTEKNPVIPNASSVNQGVYKVVITSLKCGITATDSLNVKVYDPVIPTELDGKMQEVTLCPNQALVIGQAATGGSGEISYQWQLNTNRQNTGTWNNIAGQTTSTFIGTNNNYIFTSTLANATYTYYRLMITDKSCGIYYLYYHTNVTPCMLQVNPNLKNPGAPKLEQ